MDVSSFSKGGKGGKKGGKGGGKVSRSWSAQDVEGFNCGKNGHYAKDCWSPRKEGKSQDKKGCNGKNVGDEGGKGKRGKRKDKKGNKGANSLDE